MRNPQFYHSPIETKMDQKKAFWDLFFEVLNTSEADLIAKALEIVSELDDQRTVIAQITHAATQFAANPEKAQVTQKIIKILEEKALKSVSDKTGEQSQLELDNES